MADTLRTLALGAALFSLLSAAHGPTFAQQLRDRELRPAFDFTKIEAPVEIISVKLNGKEVRPGEKVKGDDDWLRGLTFTLKNISPQPVAYVEVALQFPRPQAVKVILPGRVQFPSLGRLRRGISVIHRVLFAPRRAAPRRCFLRLPAAEKFRSGRLRFCFFQFSLGLRGSGVAGVVLLSRCRGQPT